MIRTSLSLLILSLTLLFTEVIQAQDSAGTYTISEISFDIDGNTREQAIRNYLNLTDGALIFDDYASMSSFATSLEQKLLNLRVFESVEPDLRALDSPAEGQKPYELRFRIKDSWTLFPLIVPTFDTNDELSLKWKINYANVAGTLMELNIDGDFGISQNLTNGLNVNYWTMETSLSNFFYKGVAYTGKWVQGYYRIMEKEGTTVKDFYTFDKSEFMLAGNFDMGNGYFYELAPVFGLSYNYQDKLEGGSGDIEKEALSYGIYQRGGRNQVNWKGNFLVGENWEGLLKSRIVPGKGFKAALFLSNRWYTILSPRLAFSNRVTGFTTLNDEQFKVGEYMRGVADFNLSGDNGLFINNTLSISLFNWTGIMETQIQPFMDFGIVNPAERDMNPQDDMRMSMGSDVVFFPAKITSVNLRFTFGLDLFGPGTLSDRFEMLLSTSLFF